MANFCYKCGVPTDPKDTFCRKCGVTLKNAQEAAPQNRTQAFIENRRRQMLQQNQPVRQPFYPNGAAGPIPPAAKYRGRKRGGKAVVAIILVIALLGGVLFTGFYKPGFFVRVDDPEALYGTTPHEETEDPGSTDNVTDALSHSVYESTDWEELDYSALAEQQDAGVSTDPAACSLRFDDQAVANAKEQSAAVSEANAAADFGDVKVNIKGWNLDNPEDTLSVKDLGEISEGEGGWSIIGYDFSLASGQNTFDTNVEITIPRTATADEVGTCVTFNEETQQWEEIYAKISEDGKSYLIKTDHFSIKGEKKLKYVYSGGTLAKEEKTVEIDNGLFHERYDPKKGTRMQSCVFADRDLLWAMYLAKEGNTIQELMSSIQELKSLDVNALKHQAADERDAACLFIGTAGGMDNLNTLMGNIGYDAPFLGTYLTAADVALNLMNVQATAMESEKPYLEALWDAIDKQQQSLGNSIITASLSLAASAAYGNWVGALVGTVMWGTTYVIDKAMEPAAWDVTDTPEWSDLYKVFYLTSGAKVTCGSSNAKAAIESGQYTYASMKRPSAFTKEEWAELSKVINKKPLRVEEVYDEEAGAYRYDFINFAPAFAKIIELFYEKPYQMEGAFEAFYASYANAMWNLPDKNLYNFVKYQCELGAGTEYFEEEFTAAGDILRPLEEERTVWREDMISLVRARTAEQLEDAFDMALNKTYSQITQNMNRLESLLNTRLVFHVVDESLLPGQTFKDSIYCKDWQKIEENEPYYPKNNKDHSGGYDDPELVTPMRFVCDGPLFKPMEGVKSEDGSIANVSIPYTEYYPYVPDFLPRAKKNQKDDVVYTCTLYHYLMMDAPKQMLFKDCSDPKKYMEIEGVLADIEIPEIKEGMRSVDVIVRIGDGNEISKLEGYWGPAPNGTPYEKKESGSVNLIIENGGRNNTFLSELKTQPACSYHEGGDSGDSKFVYTRNAKKEGEKQTGILTIWKPNAYPDEKLSFTVEEVERNVIFLKEWNLYLMRWDAPAGAYSLTVERDQWLDAGKVRIPDASLKVEDDGTVTLTVPGVSGYKYEDRGEKSTTSYKVSRGQFVLKAQKSSMQDIPYGYDDAIGKVFTITSADSFDCDKERVYKPASEKGNSSTTTEHRRIHSARISRGAEEDAACAYIVLYYDCKDTSKLRFVQVYLVAKSDSRTTRDGKEKTNTKDGDITYYMQMSVK